VANSHAQGSAPSDSLTSPKRERVNLFVQLKTVMLSGEDSRRVKNQFTRSVRAEYEKPITSQEDLPRPYPSSRRTASLVFLSLRIDLITRDQMNMFNSSACKNRLALS